MAGRHLEGDLKRLVRVKSLVAPRQISKIRGYALVKRGWATVDQFNDRWCPKFTITQEGLDASKVQQRCRICPAIGGECFCSGVCLWQVADASGFNGRTA